MNKLTIDQVKRILSGRTLITTIGKFSVKVTNVTAFDGKFIANFAAINSYMQKQIAQLLKEKNTDEACNITLSASLLPGMYIPVKGEQVYVTTDYITTKTGEQALLVTSVMPVPVSAASKATFDFDDIEEATTTEVPEADVVLDDIELPAITLNK